MLKTPARIGVFKNHEFPPYTFNCSVGSLQRRRGCNQPGIDSDIIDYLYQTMHKSYELVVCGSTYGEIFDNGTTTGCFGSLFRGEIDMLTETYARSETRERHFNFSYPIHRLSYVAVTPIKLLPKWWTNVTRILTPFSFNIWIFIIVLVAIVTFVAWSSGRRNLQQYHISCGSVKTRITCSKTLRNTITSWAIVLTLCMGLYRSFLLSMMMIDTSPGAGISNLDELVQAVTDGEFTIYLHRGTSGIVPSLIEEHPKLANLRTALKKHPLIFVATFDAVLQKIQSGTGVTIQADRMAAHMSQRACDVNMFPVEIQHQPMTYSLMFNKEVSWVDEINAHITSKMTEINHIIGQHSGNEDRNEYCANLGTSAIMPTYLNLESLASAFVFVCAGAALATLVCMIERVV